MDCLKYCVIGCPVGHSLSPRLFNRAFKKLKIKARYELAEVAPRDLGKFMRVFRTRYAGASVTIPHKERMMKHLDRVSPEARAIGAVNAIVNRRGKLFGYNTDVYGAMAALRVKRLKGKRAVVLGAGGAARAVVYGLRQAGARVLILNRTLARAKKLAREFGCEAGPLSSRPRLGGGSNLACDILINTTSVGMRPGSISEKLKTPLPDLRNFIEGALSLRGPALAGPKQSLLVMDIIYRPRMTKFLRDAKQAGCRVITGDKMFLAQAEKSFELWTGRKFPTGRSPACGGTEAKKLRPRHGGATYCFKNSDPLTSGGGGASSGSASP